MVSIVSDTSTLYSSAQARDAGFSVSPLSVTIGGNSYREFDEISADQFVELIRQGNMPTSSQPAVGDVAALYQQFSGDEILNVAMADGLSGTYASAPQQAEQAHRILAERFPDAAFEIHPLSPAFITQGGPNCVAVQVIRA